MTATFESSVGIVGNLGPIATVRLYEKIIQRFQKHREAVRNSEFPRIHVHSPRAIENVRTPDEDNHTILSYLLESIEHLSAMNVDLIAIPCNTVHTHLSTLRGKSSAPIINMIEATAESCATSHESEALILATRKTLKDGLYQKELMARGIKAIVPDEQVQCAVDRTIDSICAGANELPSVDDLIGGETTMASHNSIVLACTELSELLGRSSSTEVGSRNQHRRVHDSLSILADAIYAELTTTKSGSPLLDRL